MDADAAPLAQAAAATILKQPAEPIAAASDPRAADAEAEQTGTAAADDERPPVEASAMPEGTAADAEVKAEERAEAAAAVAAEPAGAEEAAEPKAEPNGGTEAGAAAQVKEESMAKVKGEAPSDEAVVARLRQLLAEVDLATTTEKQLRKRLEGEFGAGLGDRKALLRGEINAYLEAQPVEDEEDEDDDDEEEEEEEAPKGARKRKASGSSLGSFLSPEMQDFMGVERLPRTQVVKRMWEYIKAHDLQDPNNKRVILLDDALKKLFPGEKTDMFKMQKQLSKHCKTSDVVGGSESDRGEEDEEDAEARPAAKRSQPASSAAPKSSSGSRRKSRGSGEADGKERKPNGFTKECKLSDEMAAWIGKPTASRPEITKFFWAYCKERGLQDPSDKSVIMADAALKGLTGEERFKGFSFSKYIKAHFQGYADA